MAEGVCLGYGQGAHKDVEEVPETEVAGGLECPGGLALRKRASRVMRDVYANGTQLRWPQYPLGLWNLRSDSAKRRALLPVEGHPRER